MSNSPGPRNPRPNPLTRLVQTVRRPIAIAVGMTSVSVIIAGSVGFRVLMKEILPNWIEKTLTDALNREVIIGEVKSYSLTTLQIGLSSLPETSTNPYQLKIQGIEAEFNPLFFLLQGRLPVKVILKEIDGYIKQDPQGKWLNLKVDNINLPIDLDLVFEIQDADIKLQPKGKVNPLILEIEGKGRYLELPKQKKLNYDLTLASLNNQVNLKGNTLFPTGKTQVELIIQKLALQEIASLIGNLPIQINQGQVKASINAQIPSFKDTKNSQSKGNIKIQSLTAKTKLKEPIKISTNFFFTKYQTYCKKFQLNWSEIQANAVGNLDWEKGLDLDINIKPFNISKLTEKLSLSLPFSVKGNLQSQLNVKGNITNPVVIGVIKNNQFLLLDKISLKEFNTNFQATLDQLTIKNIKIKPVAGGEIQAQGVIKTQLKKYLKQPKAFNWSKLPLKFTFNTDLPTQKLIDIYYKIPSEAQIGNFQAKGQITGTFKTPQALFKWQFYNPVLASANNISGQGEFLLFNQNLILQNTQFETAQGKVTLTGRGNLKTNLWQTNINANSFTLTPSIAVDRGDIKLIGTFDKLDIKKISGVADLSLKIEGGTLIVNSQLQQGNIKGTASLFQLPLNQFLPDLAIPVKIAQTQANFSGNIANLLTPNLDQFKSFNVIANLQLLVDNRPVLIQTNLNQGILKADLTTAEIALSPLIPNLTIPVSLNRSKINISGQILSFFSILNLQDKQENNLYQDIKIRADTQLKVANNIIDATAKLNNNQWETQIFAFNIPNTSFCPPIEISCPPIDAKVILAGNLDALIQKNPIIPVQAKTILLQVEGQNLKADGNIILANLTTKPDANLNLNVEYSSNLKSLLPLDEFISQIPIQRELLLTNSSITGKTYFKGRLTGNNLLTAFNPLEKIQLIGNAELTNLSINNRYFEPRMTGPLNISIQRQISLNLKGKQDIFAFTLERCLEKSCHVPYLPNSFEVRQSYKAEIPAQIIGKRQGEVLIADLDNFPLDLLQFTPIKTLGIPDTIRGNVDANVKVNLFTLGGNGNINIQNPSLGNIKAESFETELLYNNGLAQLKGANLQIGKNRYDLEGNFDVNTQALRGKLEIDQGNIQDLIEVTNLASLFNPNQKLPSQTATAIKLQPYSIGSANSPISQQLNQFRESEQKIRQQAARVETGLVAPVLDLQGKFKAEVTLGGTLKNPQANLQFKGQQWQWFPKPQYLNFIDPVGLVIQEPQTIPIEQITLKGNLENGKIEINYQSQLATAVIAVKANLRQQNAKWIFQESTFKIQNFSLDLLRYFFKLPIDISGQINAQGIVQGNPLKPNIMTNFVFIDGTLNGRPLNIPIEGNLSYANQRFTLNTTDSPAIKVFASVPYPVELKKNDRIKLDLKLTTESFTFLDLLTQGKLNWIGGEGEINLTANGRIDLTEQFKIYDLNSNGEITLNNASFQIPNLNRPLIFNGQLAFNNQYLQVKQLQGNILDTQVDITGILPLFEPLANNPNPFTITLLNGKIDSQDLYRGEVSTNVMITGTAISPIIGGDVNISNGQIFLGRFQEKKPIVSPVYQQWAGNNNLGNKIIKPPQLNNFRVSLDNIKLIQDKKLPQYQLTVGGELNLNGNLTSLANIKPTGKIRLEKGKVYILTTDVFLANQYDNTLTFLPEKGLFNPYLDVQLKTFLWDTAIVANTNNEIPDDITQSNRRKSVEIALTIKGQAEQLYNVTESVEKACEFERNEEISGSINTTVIPELSQQLTDCLRVAAFVNTESDLQLLKSPIITISSSPPLTQNELTVLFNRQSPELSDPLQEQNSAQLLEIGIPQIAVTLVPFVQQEVYDLNNWAAGWAKSTFGLDRLQIVPLIQTGYKLKDGTRVRISYDYLSDEVTVRYETQW